MLFYRVVISNPPTIDDFLSGAERGTRLSIPPELERLRTGVSMYATIQQAAAKARRFPGLGSFIAAVELSPELEVRIERTTRQRGHHTLWGDPANLLRFVVAVVPVDEVR